MLLTGTCHQPFPLGGSGCVLLDYNNWYNYIVVTTWHYTLKTPKWSTEEIENLKFIYSSFLPEERVRLSPYLRLLPYKSLNQIYREACKRGLARRSSSIRAPKKPENYKVNPSQFFNPENPEVCYILGLLWADGYLVRDSIRLETTSEDMDHFYPILIKTGEWSHYTRVRGNRKPQTTAYTNNKLLTSFLSPLGYAAHSNIGPDMILNLIPDDLKPYFMQGYIDGDGCFYYSEKNNCRQFSISSRIDQDWKIIIEILEKAGIPCKVTRRDSKANKHSYIRAVGTEKISKLWSYLTSGRGNLILMLPRKVKKIKDMGVPLTFSPETPQSP